MYAWLMRLLLPLCILLATSSHTWSADDLQSWNDGATKKSIIDFVERVTKEGSADFIPVPERVAVFDNDGTLWAEQPLYFQLFFALDRVKVMAPDHPEWKTQEPFASLLKGDVKGALAGGEKAIMEIVMATHSGMSSDEFDAIIRDWVKTAKHPKSGKHYTEMVYQPMVELLRYLRANGFRTYIVSGGGIDFMRPWTEEVYGIPPSRSLAAVARSRLKCRTARA